MALRSHSPPVESPSHLCQEESWERVNYYPPAICMATKCRERFSFKDKLYTHYCDIKERYTARHILCTQRGCRCSFAYNKYFFWSKAIVLILLMNVFFSTAMHGVAVKLLQFYLGPDYSLMPVVLAYGTAQILFPTIGHVSDVYVRRHSVVRFSIWSAWFALVVLGVSLSLESYSSVFSAVNRYATLPAVFVLLSVAYVCFMTNVIPFALDQLQEASHVHYNSFFYWWYWTLNIGVVLVNTPEYCSNELGLRLLIHVEGALMCVTIACILDVLLKHWFVIEPHSSKLGNPIVQICRVLCYAANPPPNQHIPSVVHHELDLSSCNRLQLAKKRFGGKFETEQVEDTKTFFHVLLVVVSVGFLLVSYFGVFNTISLMENHMHDDIPKLTIRGKVCGFSISGLPAMNGVSLLVLIPVLDLLVVPLLRHTMFHPNILKRLGMGATFTLLSVFSLLVLEGVGDQHTVSLEGSACAFSELANSQNRNEVSSFWLILPMMLITFAEIFIYIPGFEFISAQAPSNMRGLLIGIFFSIRDFSSLLSLLLQQLFLWAPVKTHTFQAFGCAFWFYLVLAGLAIIAVGLYSVIACKYKRRKRDDLFNTVGMLEEYYFSTLRQT